MARPLTPDGIRGRKLGMTGLHIAERVRDLGGAEYLESLTPETRELLFRPFRYGTSRTVSKGGLRARGMKPRVPAKLTQMEPA